MTFSAIINKNILVKQLLYTTIEYKRLQFKTRRNPFQVTDWDSGNPFQVTDWDSGSPFQVIDWDSGNPFQVTDRDSSNPFQVTDWDSGNPFQVTDWDSGNPFQVTDWDSGNYRNISQPKTTNKIRALTGILFEQITEIYANKLMIFQ